MSLQFYQMFKTIAINLKLILYFNKRIKSQIRDIFKIKKVMMRLTKIELETLNFLIEGDMTNRKIMI